MKLSATHAFNCIVLRVKFGRTSCEDIPPALHYMLHIIQFYSDTAYRTKIQLVVLAHNAHINHNTKQHTHGLKYQYHRRYRKQTINWDAEKVIEAKEYKFISDLIEAVLKTDSNQRVL